MSTALLQELNQELRRLYIAGSDLAAGDFRLKRLLPQFQQLGERSPVFKRLGEGISSLVEQAEEQGAASAVKLQDLALLLGSILYTQGSTAPLAEPDKLASRPILLKTNLSYRKLAEVQQALSTTGSGRYEIVKDAYEQGVFQDLRLLPAAIAALRDPYSELAEFARDAILPAYGKPITAFLLKDFDPSGGKSESRKLHVIERVSGAEQMDFICQAAENGSDEVRTTAIRLLAGYTGYEAALLNFSMEKKKPIREAAFRALAASETVQAADRLYEAFSGKDIELAASALSESERLDARIVRDFAADLEKTPEIKGDKKREESLRTRLNHYQLAVVGKYSEGLTEIYSSILQQHSLYTSLGWIELVDWAANYISSLNTPEGLALIQEVEKKNHRYLPHAFQLAFRLWSPAVLYEQYAEPLANQPDATPDKGTKQREQKLLQVIEDMVVQRAYQMYDAVWRPSSSRYYSISSLEPVSPEEIADCWDPRWLRWSLEKNKPELVSAFARPGEPLIQKYLLRKLNNNPEFRNKYASLLLMGLERVGAELDVRQEALMAALEDKRNNNCYVFDIYVFNLLCGLPSSFLSRLEAVLPMYRYEAGEQLSYVIRTLSQRGEQ
ncbi:HEAT repeat domain-containing protein [Paenibacillus sp. NPDC056722]|uniref:HEAT repeat domain-containing protein n=1 Tax=Paenibacillus sp. NPDC056722 TaxID=3345924 RepID=UPI0036848CF0